MNKERPTIIDFVEHYTEKFASHVFLREKVGEAWTETTFRQTREEAHLLGAGLMSMGVKPGDKFALLSEGRNLWILGELGILYAGAVNVPLSIKLVPEELLFRIRHSEAKYVMTSSLQLDKIRAVVADCPCVEKVFVFDELPDYNDKEQCIGDVRKAGEEYLKEHSAEFEARYGSVGPDDYANISYTSGTTADPKGILLTHRNYTANVEQAHSVVACGVDDVMLIILPLDHCFAHVAGFYTMMSYGGSIATVPAGKTAISATRNIPMAIREVRPMLMLSVPALARSFKASIEAAIKKKGPKVEKLYEFALDNAIKYNREYYNRGGLLRCWRKPLMDFFDKKLFAQVRESLGGRMKFFVGGGALLDIALQRYYCAIGIPMFQGYGLSEATPIISANSMGHAIFGSSGRCVKPMDIKICDEDGKEVAPGVKGEIVIRGENVMAGYWKNPHATEETIVDGWLHTGDMGYMKKDKEFLWVTGRFKSLLIASDGEKYSPEGFEDSLTDSSKYIDQVVLHDNQDPYPIVLIVPNKDALKEYVSSMGKSPNGEEGRRLMLDKIQGEIDSYKKGGSNAGVFPERWLPAAVAVLSEHFTEENHLVNSTMKIVRGKVEKTYADRIAYALTAEGKKLYNEKNMAALE